MDKATEMVECITGLIEQYARQLRDDGEEAELTVVNPVVGDVDGIVEDRTDLSIKMDGWIWNATIYVDRWGLIEPKLTTTEAVNLGIAIGSFSTGEIDQGIHAILPATVMDTGQKVNQVFRPLFDDYFNSIDAVDQPEEGHLGMNYIKAIEDWARHNNIDIGR